MDRRATEQRREQQRDALRVEQLLAVAAEVRANSPDQTAALRAGSGLSMAGRRPGNRSRAQPQPESTQHPRSGPFGGLRTQQPENNEIRCPPEPQINIPAWVFCVSWCANF